jgi:hypothetical protein
VVIESELLAAPVQGVAARESLLAGLLTRKAIRAEAALTRLLNQVDEQRSPKTEATVNHHVDRWLEMLDVERRTRIGYIGKIEKHIRPDAREPPLRAIAASPSTGMVERLPAAD